MEFSELSDICLVNLIESNKQLEHDTSNINLLFDSCQTLQNNDGKPNINLLFVIYYASKTLDSTQMNYLTIEKELLVVVFVLNKFR